MAINENWNIRTRAQVCAHSARPFAEGEVLVTALVEDVKTGELARRDYALEAWPEVEAQLAPGFSFWRTAYEVTKVEGRPEIVEKESAEVLLRRLCEEDSIATEKTRYILAVMLERKKQLKQTGTRETEEASYLIYEQPKSGEVFLIRDPELKLAQLEEVQLEVSRLLGGGGEAAPEAAAGPEAGPALEEGPGPGGTEAGGEPGAA